MNIVLLGYTGSGKTTQGSKLSSSLGLIHISLGNIFRDEIARKTPIGLEVHDYVSSGRLVPDWLTLNFLKDRFGKEKSGFLFDAFPATMEQAEGLDAWLATRSSSVTAAFLLKMPEAEAQKRAAGRRVCGACGAVWNLHSRPPMMAEMCNNCGGKLAQRADDRPDILKRRFLAFHDQTDPLLSYYRSNSEFFEIDAMQPEQQIFSQIAVSLKKVI